MAINMNRRALLIRPPLSVTIVPTAFIQRLGSIVLSTLDRSVGVPVSITRIVVHCNRLVVFHLPLPFHIALKYQLDERLMQRTPVTARLIAEPAGCAILVDLRS